MYITVKLLKEKGACSKQVREFAFHEAFSAAYAVYVASAPAPLSYIEKTIKSRG